VSWLSGLLGGSSKPKTVSPNRRSPQWTTEEELENARKYDLSYGDPSAGFFQPGARMRMPRSLPEMFSAFQNRVAGNLPLQPIDEQMASRLQSAWLATRSSPLAALGFDPRSMITAPSGMTEGRNLTIGGTYAPSRDEIFTTGQYDSTFVHEAIHRGIEKLRQAGKLPEAFKNAPEELVTRLFMRKYFGDVEKGRGAQGDAQIRDAETWEKYTIPRPAGLLDALENAAAQYSAEQTPRGPR
jgi:hypothetical protein